MSIKEKLRDLASVDLFKEAIAADAFVGRPFYFDFSKMKILSNDHWKEKVGGIAAGAFPVQARARAESRIGAVVVRRPSEDRARQREALCA